MRQRRKKEEEISRLRNEEIEKMKEELKHIQEKPISFVIQDAFHPDSIPMFAVLESEPFSEEKVVEKNEKKDDNSDASSEETQTSST